MKQVKLKCISIFLVIVISPLFPAQFVETEPTASASRKTEIINSDEVKHKLITERTAETNDELCDILIYLLEHGTELSDKEIEEINGKIGEDANIHNLYNWYINKSLDSMKLRVLDKSVILEDRKTEYEWDGLTGGRDYLLRVEVCENGGLNIPLGIQEWVFQTNNCTIMKECGIL